MLKERGTLSNTELKATTKIQVCKCENQMKVVDETVGAKDLSQVILTEYDKTVRYDGILTLDDLKYQEERRRRGVRKLTYEER